MNKQLTILLDVDGVLNIYSKSYTTRGYDTEDHLVCRLNYLVKELSNKYDITIVPYTGWTYSELVRKCAKYPAIVTRLLDAPMNKSNPNNLTFVDTINRMLHKLDIPHENILYIEDELKESRWDDNMYLHKVDCSIGLSDSDINKILKEY